MKFQYEHKSAMTLIGFSTTIRPNEGYIKCPEFWDKEYARKYARLWQTMRPETPTEAAILENGIGSFAIREEKEALLNTGSRGFTRAEKSRRGSSFIPSLKATGRYFRPKGPLPGSLQALNTYVWQEWYPKEDKRYMGHGNTMLEVYTPGNMQAPDYECGIWVPVERK